MATLTAPITAEELLALPDDGVERWLVAGELREQKQTMTRRNRYHSLAMTRIARFLDNWLDEQPHPRGQVLTGDAAVRLERDPDSLYRIDVAYVSAAVMAAQSPDAMVIDGVPTLAVEILSPSDTVESINEKIDAYLDAGVPLVWIIEPVRRTVMIYQPNAEPECVNARHDLSGDPHLPGFSVSVLRLFD